MKNKIENLLETVFSISLMIAIFGGGIVFLMFIAALIIGGDSGGSLAVNASKSIMPYFIRLAAIAVLSGLIKIYIRGEHELSLQD